MTKVYGKSSTEINQLIDSVIAKTRHTLTQIIESAEIDDENNLTQFPTEDVMFLIAVCVDYLKGKLIDFSLFYEIIIYC